MFIFKQTITEKMLKEKSYYTFVYGDNMQGNGKKGQAIIRDLPNAFGVPTKRKPTMMEDAFFSDKKEEYDSVRKALLELHKKHKLGEIIVLPLNPFGSGLARLPENSPKIWEMIEKFYVFAKENELKETFVCEIEKKGTLNILFEPLKDKTILRISNTRKLKGQALLALEKFANDRGGYFNYEAGELIVGRKWSQKMAQSILEEIGFQVYFETEEERLPLYKQKVLFGKYRNNTWEEVPLEYLKYMLETLKEEDKPYKMVYAEIKRRDFEGHINLKEVVSFGKYKGSRWVDLPLHYLEWLSESLSNDNENKIIAQQFAYYKKEKGIRDRHIEE